MMFEEEERKVLGSTLWKFLYLENEEMDYTEGDMYVDKIKNGETTKEDVYYKLFGEDIFRDFIVQDNRVVKKLFDKNVSDNEFRRWLKDLLLEENIDDDIKSMEVWLESELNN